ncbi:hypothetical protein BJ875DRAFT_444941 [Amylocarpus encephaloides]|uniref:DUF7888 domain-containing protein n=1 Tax=Amylocarpus encephaloides TaxID=45428 RepID=A0A9P8C1J7_9HELO|nr:hypothetical protein BJ875DRAFT_444941 [Amylocarpus encephaloides]
MLSKNVLFACIAAFATFASAAPLSKRAVDVSSDTGVVSITPQITADVASDLNDVGGKADAAGAVANVINKAVQLVQGMVDNDIKRRQAFTQETVAAVSAAFSGQPVITSNVGYSITGTAPVTVQETSYNAKVGSNVSFDVIILSSGSFFTLEGDGGFENWAYIIPSTCSRSGKTITC